MYDKLLKPRQSFRITLYYRVEIFCLTKMPSGVESSHSLRVESSAIRFISTRQSPFRLLKMAARGKVYPSAGSGRVASGPTILTESRVLMPRVSFLSVGLQLSALTAAVLRWELNVETLVLSVKDYQKSYDAHLKCLVTFEQVSV